MNLLAAFLGIFAPELVEWDAIDAAGNDNWISRARRSPFLSQFLPHVVRNNPCLMEGVKAIERASTPIGRHRRIVNVARDKILEVNTTTTEAPLSLTLMRISLHPL